MKNPFSRRIRRAFVACMLALLLCSAISIITLKRARDKESWVQHTHLVIQRLEFLLSVLKDAETGARGFVITNQPQTLAPYNHAEASCKRILHQVQTLTRDNPQQQAVIGLLAPNIRQQFGILATYIDQTKRYQKIGPEQIEHGKQVMDRARALVKQMEERESLLLKNRNAAWHELWGYIPLLIGFLTTLSVLSSTYFCRSLLANYYEKVKFRRELQQHGIVTNNRIHIIQSVTAQVAGGNYAVQIVGQERDILGNLSDDINRMTNALDESFGRLREWMDKKDEFINITAHEFRTPLTSIQATLQFMGRLKSGNEEVRKLSPFIEKANNQIKKLTGILKDLLDVSRINSNNLIFTLSYFNITQAIKEQIEEIEIGNTSQDFVLSGEKDLLVHADQSKIMQVVANLLSNAVKYSFPGSPIRITISVINRMARVSVSDEGKGISANKLPFVFDRYFRVEETSKNYSGMGLGLFIAKEIVEQHGGAIGVGSTVGKGTTFWFTLPLAT
jgi:signal transduction histidine kinase